MSIAGLNQKELVDNSLNQSVETSKTVQSFIGRDVVTITDRSLPTIAKVIGLVAFAGLVSISVGKVLEGVFSLGVLKPNIETDNALEKLRSDAASGNETAILNLCEIDPGSVLKILKNNRIAENLKQESNKEKAPKHGYQPDTSLDVCEPNTERDNALKKLRLNAVSGKNSTAILNLWKIDSSLVDLTQVLKKRDKIFEAMLRLIKRNKYHIELCYSSIEDSEEISKLHKIIIENKEIIIEVGMNNINKDIAIQNKLIKVYQNFEEGIKEIVKMMNDKKKS